MMRLRQILAKILEILTIIFIYNEEMYNKFMDKVEEIKGKKNE